MAREVYSRIITLVLRAAELARTIGIYNLLQPGLVKEMIIANLLGHELTATKRDADARHPNNSSVVYEINYCSSYGWIGGEQIAEFIKTQKPKWLHLLLTGRDAPQSVIDAANTVTEMTKIKHAFDEGVLAAQGVEF